MIDIKFLESQNKGLKAQNIELQQEINELKAENKQLNDIIDSYQPRIQKYKDVLQEIKTIAEGRTKTEDYLLGQEYTELVDRILDLITKAEEE